MFNPFIILKDIFASLIAWLSNTCKQSALSYCELETADSSTTLVANDGSLISILRIDGIKLLLGKEEFDRIKLGLQQSLQTTMSQPGHVMQVYFNYDPGLAKSEIEKNFQGARTTARTLKLKLDDLFDEQINYLPKYCAHEEAYLVLWTRLKSLTTAQLRQTKKDKLKQIKTQKIPPFFQTQNLMAAVPELRENHDSFVRLVSNDFGNYGIVSNVLEVHHALRFVRESVDPDFTDRKWMPLLPGDKITIREYKQQTGTFSDVLWPSLAKQLLPRDAANLDLRTARVGDRIYSTVFIELFPREVQPFVRLFQRALQTRIPWRISFLAESNGLENTRWKKVLSSVFTITSSQNRLLNDSINLLEYIQLHTDDAVVKLRVAASTWAPEDEIKTLRSRASLLAKSIEGWGSCDVSEMAGDAFQGVISTMLALSGSSIATPSIAPLSSVIHMLPLFRPASPWQTGGVLFRSPDGKIWPYHPGSHQQTTWIDLFYARPGSGKSVLSNAINLAVALSSGIQRLPRIAVIDIGPSSSGLISLLRDALPSGQKHFAAYHRLRMRSEYAINVFDTQLGCRHPTPQERGFLVNFLTLLATPVGAEKAYDGIADMSGLIIDELYKSFHDDNKPNIYATGVDGIIDGVLEEIAFVADRQTTWWEITDALFAAGFQHEAMLAQRYAIPVLSDVATICRLPVIQDLYSKLITPTGEGLIQAFSRMISSAVREYPILSQVTRFDLGDARVVALDLDEVAKSGGEAAQRQTAVMYMLARYVLARHYFLTDDNVQDMPEMYRHYHQNRIGEIREDPKRIVFDEFHRTARVKAVRDQVIQDMREGRKWKVQVALLSQSLDDFDEIMIEFATSVFIMDAGPEQAIRKTAEIFGLNETARLALKTRVHGPNETGATFLGQFATKAGNHTQLLTLTLGPIELWALNTTAEDVYIRNHLYRRIGPNAARSLLAKTFPTGTATKAIEERLSEQKEAGALIDDDVRTSVVHEIINELH